MVGGGHREQSVSLYIVTQCTRHTVQTPNASPAPHCHVMCLDVKRRMVCFGYQGREREEADWDVINQDIYRNLTHAQHVFVSVIG